MLTLTLAMNLPCILLHTNCDAQPLWDCCNPQTNYLSFPALRLFLGVLQGPMVGRNSS